MEDQQRGQRITVVEIARELGLSQTTVSRALSGKGRVAPETRRRVIEFASSSGREAITVRRATRNVALVIPQRFAEFDLPYLRSCMLGVCRMAVQRRYDVLLCFADETDTSELEWQLKSRKMDGVILSQTMLQDPCVELLRRADVPFVALGRLERGSDLQIDNDQVAAAREMTDILLRLGLRDIAYLGGDLRYLVNQDRLDGFRLAMESAGGSAPGIVVTGIETTEQHMDAMEMILERRPDCLLCGDDSLALMSLDYLSARGIHVPEDMRLASLYDSELLRKRVPSVTAVHFEAASLGAAGCRMLLDRLEGRDIKKQQVIGYQVILRESTK